MKIKLFNKKDCFHITGIKLITLISMLYLALETGIQRNSYSIVVKENEIKRNRRVQSKAQVENKNQGLYKNKILLDIKYHDLKKNTNKKTTTQILINQEGKVVGYKFCNIFYPNYFTKQQPKVLLKTARKFRIKKLNFCIAKFCNTKMQPK